MQFQRYKTADGFPGVAWEQEVLTGETAYSRTRELQWKLAVLLGLVVFGAMLGAGSEFGTAVFGGIAAAVVVAAPEALRAMRLHIPGATIGGFDKTAGERETERRWKVTRLYRRERRWAEVRFEPHTKALFFVLKQAMRDRALTIYEVPLLSFAELELSTDQEWFGDIGARELGQQLQVGSAWVIVAQAEGHGVLLIARSGRDKAGMAHLHQVLRAEFIDIGRRRELRAKADELASTPRTSGGGTGTGQNAG
jgi:hypothetical protein